MRNLVLLFLLFLSVSLMAQTVPLNEDFEGNTLSVTSSGSPGWSLSTSLFNGGSKSDSASIVTPGDSSVLITDAFATTGNGHVILEFDHICKIEFFDAAEVYVSADNGLTWTKLTENEYLGNSNFSAVTGNKFTSGSYGTWQVGITATPDNTWWKHETFDISAIAANASSVKVRFDLVDKNNATIYDNYAWFIDDIKVTTALSEYDPPVISMASANPSGAKYSFAPYSIDATITDASGIEQALLIYSKNNQANDTVVMQSIGNDNFRGVIDTAGNPIIIGDTFCYSVFAMDSSAYSLTDTAPNPGCTQFYIDSLPFPSCSVTKTTFPYTQTFAGFSTSSTSCIPINHNLGTSGWINSTWDDNEWIPISANYQYYTTGSQFDHTTGNSSGRMLALRGCYNKTATLLTPCFDLRNTANPVVEFWYHMKGSSIGTLSLEVQYGGQWIMLWSKSGQQGSNWIKASIPMGQYKHVVKMRIKGTTGNGNASMITLDDFVVKEGPINDLGVTAITSPANGVNPGLSPVTVRLENFAANPITQPMVAYSVNSTLVDTFQWSGTLIGGADTLLTIDTFNFAVGNSQIKAYSILPNQVADTDASNDTSQISLNICAGTLAGVYTIDPSQAISSTNYISIEDAVANLRLCGITSAVTFKLASGTYTIGDLLIDSITGSSTTNLITFESATGNPDDVIIQGSSAAVFTFKLVLAKNMRFKYLTFKANATGTAAKCLNINNYNENIHFIGNKFIGRTIASEAEIYDLVVFGADSRCKDLQLVGNEFHNGSMGIHIKSTATKYNQSLIIKNNTFHDVYHRAIWIQYTDSLVVEGNTFTGNTSTSSNSIRVFAKFCNYFNINANHMQSKATGIFILNCNGATTQPRVISNNTIKITGTSSYSKGISFKTSSNVNCYYNTVQMTNTNAASVAFYNEGNTGGDLMNNIFHHASAGLAIQFTSATNSTVSDYNLFYSNGSNVARTGTTDYSTLAAWTTATNQDSNSVSADVTFNGGSDFHTADLDIYQMGTPIAAVTTDMDGDTRHATTPNIGADEFLLYAKDAGITQILRPIALDSAGKIVAVQAKIKNFGVDTLFSLPVYYAVDGGTPVLTTFSDTLIANQTTTIDLANLTIPYGNHNLDVYTALTNDGDQSNDTTMLAFYGIPANDIEVVEIFTLGKLPKSSALPHNFKATVKNNSYQPQSNVAVYLNITGTNTWSDTVYISNIAIGATEMVTFGDYTPANTGIDTVKLSLGTDDDLANNNTQVMQEVSQDAFNYAYENTPASDFGGTGQLLLSRFSLKGSKIVDEVKAYITGTNTIGSIVKAVVLDSNGVIIASSANDTITAADTASYITFNVYDSTQVLVNTDFYTGIAVVGTSANILGVDQSTPVAAQSFYSSANLTVGTLTDLQSNLSGSFMIEAVMTNPPAFDAACIAIISPVDGCGLQNENVTIEIQNSGLDTLNTSLPVAYELMGGTTVNETVSVSIAPSAVYQYTFTATANLGITQDSIFKMRAWVNLAQDANRTNDTTSWNQVESTFKPAMPVAIHDTISYGDTAMLGATTTSGFGLNWYDANTNGQYLGSGSVFSTGDASFDTTSYFVEAVNAGPADLLITEFTTNPNGTGATVNMPSYVYPNTTSTHYIEITNQGGSTADLSNYTFNFYNPNTINKVHTYTFANGTQLGAGEVMLLDVRDSGFAKPIHNYYTLNLQILLWSSHAQAIYLKDASGSIVDALVMGNNLFTDSTGITTADWSGTVPPTGGLGGLMRTTADNNAASDWMWSSTTDFMSSGVMNPTLQAAYLTGGCTSDRTEVKIIVQNIPVNAAELVQIVSPTDSVASNVAHNVVMEIKNNGVAALTSLNFDWEINGIAQTPYAWTGNLATDSTTTVTIGAYTPIGGYYDLKAWISQPNAGTDPYTLNDTLSDFFTSCMSGVYTVGDTTGGASYDFTSISKAVKGLKQAGICGPVSIEMATGNYTVDHINLTQIEGSSTTNTVTFTSITGNMNDVTISANQNYVFQLNGTDNLFFEHLTLATLGNNTEKRIIKMINNNKVSFSSCTFNGVQSTTTSSNYTLIYEYGTGSDSVAVDSCTFNNGSYGFVLSGSSTNKHKALIVSNSTFNSQYYRAVYASQMINTVFENNTINGDQLHTDGVYLTSNTHFRIAGNTMTGMDKAIEVSSSDGTSAQKQQIINNMIQGVGTGIKVGLGLDYIDVLHNTVKVNGSSTSYGSTFYAYSYTNYGNVYANNIFIQEGSGYAVYISGSSTTSAVFSHNNYYSSGANLIQNSGSYATLTSYQQFNLADSNSVSYDVVFSGTNDLHCVDARLNGIADTTYNVLTDIDGESRDLVYPDMGADEFTPMAVDMKAVEFSQFNPLQASGASLQLGIKVVNYGGDTVFSLPLSYEYMGAVINDTVNVTLAPLQFFTYTFSVPLTIAQGTNAIKAYTHIAADSNLLNDTIYTQVNGMVVKSLPYASDFESSNDFSAGIANSAWEYGAPNATIIDSAYSPINAWVTNLQGNVLLQGNHYLYSPKFEVSNTMDTIVISFMKMHDLGNDNQVTVEMKNGANGTWGTVGYMTDPASLNWYNNASGGVHFWSGSSNGWEYTEYRLSTSLMGTNDTIQFRFNYNGSNITTEGFAIDNFALQFQYDAGVDAIVYPVNDTLVGSQIFAQVNIQNYGSDAISAIPLQLDINGSTVLTETANITIAAGASALYTFTSAYTVPSADYQLCASTQIIGDANATNNGTCDSLGVTQLPVDVALTSILSPVDNGGNICVNQTYYEYDVEIEIQNLGADTIKALPLAYTINGAGIVQENWTGILLPNQTTTYTFTQTWMPTQTGNLELCVAAVLANDIDTTNNLVCKTYVGDLCTGISQGENDLFTVSQNRPNPTSGLTEFDVYIPQSGKVMVKIYNQTGQLMSNREIDLSAGEQSVQLNVRTYADGVYYYSVQYQDRVYTHKLIINK